ncbi:MAG: phosphotransferase [Chloroflexota bacterium]
MQKLLVRQHGAVDRASNPQIAADEFTLLSALRAVGLPVPAPYLVDQSGEIFATPYIVMEYVEGAVEAAPANLPDFIEQSAAQLAAIHQVDAAALGLSFLPDQAALYRAKLAQRPEKLDNSLDEGRIRDVLEAHVPLLARNPAGLLHGDFWVGNLLWREGKIAVVIDWEDAKLGDPLADLGISRLEMLWAFGSEAMQTFTEHYQAARPIDLTHLPYWDLYAALRPAFRIGDWAGDALVEARMRDRHRWFITQAFARLKAGSADA